MAALHQALKSLGPCSFADVPTAPTELEGYISDLFKDSQLILESIPIPPPDESVSRARSRTVSSIASNASEMSASSARSEPPTPEFAALQKEWGKPIKLSAKENPLNMSVYKLGGKDGRGAWFARRSVHEGLGFARFKGGLQREFPESMAQPGPPGHGNVRGIGGEKKVEDIKVGNKGRVEVYHLSAQFPGPTTPRDFVTFLVTSSKAMHDVHSQKVPELSPRHYMIISKPCNHPKTQPTNNMIRGSYESVEFIREVPKKPTKSQSSIDLTKIRQRAGLESLEKEILLRNAQHKTHSFPLEYDNRSQGDLSEESHARDHRERGNHHVGRSTSSSPGRRRSATVGVPDGPTHDHEHESADFYNPEENPVEWIMITRSDPGGSVPRFMVERGTPSSIVADASKFLDWACQKEHPAEDEEEKQSASRPPGVTRVQSFQTNGHLTGIMEQETAMKTTQKEAFPTLSEDSSPTEPHNQMASSGILASMSGALSSTLEAYAPQVVLDHLPESKPQPAISTLPATGSTTQMAEESRDLSDAESSISSTSFASADSHFESEPSISSKSSPEKTSSHPMGPHEKELQKLQQRRATLDAKLASTRDKLVKDTDEQTAKEKEALKKAEEKHEKEMKKQEEKYKKEITKLEHKKEKEAQKLEERKRKQAEKDERARLTRERDEARAELELLKKEREIWLRQVGDLQQENTVLTARIGKMEGTPVAGSAVGMLLEGNRSRSSSLRSKMVVGSGSTGS